MISEINRQSFQMFKLTLLILTLIAPFIYADGDRVQFSDVNQLRIELKDERVVFEVQLKQFNRDEITEKQNGDEIEAWFGKQKLPVEALYYKPNIIESFKLSIDGKNINIPAFFWNDLSGLYLTEAKILTSNPTDEDLRSFNDVLRSPRSRPQVSRSDNGSTVLITWARPEDCDSASTIRWIISKKGTVLRHHEAAEHT